MNTFTAKYRTEECASECGAPIRPGQEACYVDGELSHVNCPTRDGETDPLAACERCNMVGPCFCDED